VKLVSLRTCGATPVPLRKYALNVHPADEAGGVQLTAMVVPSTAVADTPPGAGALQTTGGGTTTGGVTGGTTTGGFV
jgi:hypothetical protein